MQPYTNMQPQLQAQSKAAIYMPPLIPSSIKHACRMHLLTRTDPQSDSQVARHLSFQLQQRSMLCRQSDMCGTTLSREDKQKQGDTNTACHVYANVGDVCTLDGAAMGKPDALLSHVGHSLGKHKLR